ncbi:MULTISPECIES: hypothetical protein [Mycolicibacterium]|uniref:Uncharacterized protein n=1 Tax=Mycolicibacterium aichiense TaxID=1799 RepID=A0AAD1HQN8_9MYCO|nr:MULTISPECIES: hypothetical protein [Mycolicibacterium]MCV7016757.1 hypothetical protein [Mycolicibacterium aichiense]QFG08033.1 hypothetical protein SEA_HERBERTWM_66 [Mycobacterium phage Herbertwm]BBX09460.1 hypothetical protein MAIC_42630 [Mycolicibacterium aichiense]SUA14025.1 Uncharacterised protein [Mycolicibacterium aichiense]
MTATEQLKKDLTQIIKGWEDRLGGKRHQTIDLRDALYDYIIETYGPPF